MSEIQSVEGRPTKKGMSPGRTSAVGAIALLAAAFGVFAVGGLLRPPPVPRDHDLALILSTGDVRLARSDGGASAVLAGTGVPGDATLVRWAPGGDFAALRSVTALTVVDREGVVAWRRDLRSRWARFAWSPDGSRVAIYDGLDTTMTTDVGPIAAEVTLEVMSATGVLEWKVPLDESFGFVTGYETLAWTPDGGSIAFSGFAERVRNGSQTASIWLADTRAQAFRQVTHGVGDVDYAPAWSQDGSLFVARGDTVTTGIWKVDPTTGDGTQLLQTAAALCGPQAPCSGASLGAIVPSPSGEQLAFREPTTGLSVLSPATRGLTGVLESGMRADADYRWSTDGAALLYLRQVTASPEDPPDLVRFDMASRATRLVQADVRSFDLLVVRP